MRSDRFKATYSHLLDAAEAMGIGLSVKTNIELAPFDFADARERALLPDFVLFWDKDICLARLLEAQRLPVFNRADAIEICDSKALTYLALVESGIEMPDTIIVPMAFQPPSWDGESFPDRAIERLGLPLVAKESSGSFGEQVHLASSRDELVAVLGSFGARASILQGFVESSRGRDVRLQVVGDRVIAGILRSSGGGDFRANIAAGASAEPFDAPEPFERMALSVCRTIGLDFAGVDILFGEQGQPVFCEVNSNAQFEGILACCGVNAAAEILAYIVSVLEKGARNGGDAVR